MSDGSRYRRAPSDRADRATGPRSTDRGERRHPPSRERTTRSRRPVPAARVARRRRRLLVAGLGLVLVVAVVALTFATPWLDVRSVDVVGAAPENRSDVEAAAAIAPGTSLLWLGGDLSGSGVAERVRGLPRVADVDVERGWPHTLVVTVAEREPLLAVPGPGGVALVDASGFAYRTVPTAPRGVPTLRLPPGVAPAPEEPATTAAVRIVAALPPDLRGRVGEVRASGRFDVSFTLDGDRTVRWGAAEQNARKAAILRPLLTREGSVFDVSSPDLPVAR